jgi:hypothetical protein
MNSDNTFTLNFKEDAKLGEYFKKMNVPDDAYIHLSAASEYGRPSAEGLAQKGVLPLSTGNESHWVKAKDVSHLVTVQ